MNAAKLLQDSAINSAQYKTIVKDNSAAGLQWVGIAAPGSATSAAVWQIKRITTTVDGAVETTLIEWADSNLKFDNIFDNAMTTIVYG